MTPQSQTRTTNRQLAALTVSLIGPVMLTATCTWLTVRLPVLNHPVFILSILVSATGLGGFLFSKSIKCWPSIQSLSILYWFSMPIALAAISFILYVRISGDGP
jgi:hypothetical protein